MVCSKEQLAANQRNAQLSTGPKSVEGKEKSRRNGLKHGRTGGGVVIPDEDIHELDERIEIYEEGLQPRTDLARQLTHKAAYLSIRLDRAAREDSARLTKAMYHAQHDEEDEHYSEIDRLAAMIPLNPAEAVRKLRRSPEGIDRLILNWESLRATLEDPNGDPWMHGDAQLLMGKRALYSRTCRFSALTRAIIEDFAWLEPTDWPDLPDAERREAAHEGLIALVDGKIVELQATRAAIDHEMLAEVRAGAASRAIFQVTKAAILARKYEAATERSFQKAVKQVAELNAAAEAEEREAAKAGLAKSPNPEKGCGKMGSSFPEPKEQPEPAAVEPIPVAPRPKLPVESRISRRKRGRDKRSGA